MGPREHSIELAYALFITCDYPTYSEEHEAAGQHDLAHLQLPIGPEAAMPFREGQVDQHRSLSAYTL